MAKRKKRSNVKRGGWFQVISRVLSFGLRGILRVLPVVILGALIFLGYVRVKDILYADSLLDVRSIQIIPENSVSAAVKEDIEKKWIGQNIFSVDVRKVSDALKNDAMVFSAQTVKRFPNSLEIQIVPRRPFAKVQFAKGGDRAVISEDGYILERADQKSTFKGPLLDVFESEWKKPIVGTRMSPKGLEEAVLFYEDFKRYPLSETESITQMSLDYLGNLTVTLNAGPDVKLGRHPSELMSALRRLDPFLEPSERTKIQYIDLQFEDVVIKKKVR